jgi:alpha-glucosidase
MNVQFNEYISIARRKNDDWWVGAITNDIPRDLVLSLNFLDKNNLYEAFIYTDATDTSENPNKLVFEKER